MPVYPAASGGGGSVVVPAFSSGAFQRNQSGAYMLNVGITNSPDNYWAAPKAGTIYSIGGYCNGTSGQTFTFTIWKNVVATAMSITVTLDGTNKAFNLVGQSLAFNQNDLISVAGQGSTAFSVTCMANVSVIMP